MTTSTDGHNKDNVVDLFTGKPYSHRRYHRIIRLAPEMDGLEMVYSNDAHPDKFFSLKVLCWALKADGEVVGMVPWLDKVVACNELQDPLNGMWEGYSAAEYYEIDCNDEQEVIQEIPDTIGTHAVLSNDGFRSLLLKEVVSWRLRVDGTMSGTLIDEDKIEETPVLPGDCSLYDAESDGAFRYFFQHHIANKIKARDPEAMAAISLLVDK